MKKHLLFAISTLSLSYTAIAQESTNPQYKPCNTYEAMEEVFKNDPSAKARYEASQAQFELEYAQAVQNQKTMKTAATIYTVPVVFHIMGPQNISDQVIINALDQINKDYSKTGADVGTINATFAPLYVDAEIRFALAKKDPLGNCTNGIIRHDNDNDVWDQSNTSAYKYSGNGTNRWPSNKYLNIYVVSCIESASSPCPSTGAYVGGYTYLPGTWGTNASQDAIVYRASILGQSNILDIRALSHEMGHWINLQHTFGSTNNPGVSCGDDGVTDTPPTKGNFSTCPNSNGTNTCDASGNQNVENIMDYSGCPKMFTQGQVTRMRTAITSSTGGRNNLWSAANYAATGLTGSYTCTPVADFKANKLNNCVSNPITFTSNSQVGTSGTYTWTFQGGTPATSNATTQVVTYNTPGTYSVSLSVSNATGSNTMNKTSYITITNGTGGISAPNVHDFETTGIPSDITVVNKNGGSVAWTQNTSTGASSTSKCMMLNNASTSNTAGHIDWFETPIYNFSNTTNIALSYYYAYAKKNAAQADSFKVQYSLDCGGSWTNVIGIPSTAAMATASGGTLSSAFTPSAAQWKQTNIVSALLTALNNKPSVKFRWYFRNDMSLTSSNNLYIDQINISGTVGLNELENAIGLNIYPNPTNSSSLVEFNTQSADKVNISVIDLLGKTLEVSAIDAPNGKVNYTVNKDGSLAQGIYMINIEVNGQRLSKKLIVE